MSFSDEHKVEEATLLATDSSATRFDRKLLPKMISELFVKKVDITRPLYNKILYDKKEAEKHFKSISNPKFKFIYERELKEIKHGDENKVYFTFNNQSITGSDLVQLGPDKNTSDKVINMYAKMLCERSGSTEEINIYPTELFTNMYIDNGNVYKYDKKKNWNRTKPLKDYSILIFPIFVKKCHWAVVVVFMKSKEMYYIDSLNFDGKDFLKCILRYLYDEFLMNYGMIMQNLSDWKLFHKGIGSAQQGDTLNCGIFALLYMDMLLTGLPISLVNETYVEFYRYFVSYCFIASEGNVVDLIASEKNTSQSEVVDLIADEAKSEARSEANVLKKKRQIVLDTDDTAVDNATRAAKILRKTKRFVIESPTEILENLRRKGIDPAINAQRVSEENAWYVAKHYKAKPLRNDGEGDCFYLATQQTLAQSGLRMYNKIAVVFLKQTLKQGMLENQDSIRQILPEMESLTLADTNVKYKNWVKKFVDDYAVEHIFLLASFLWNVKFELICDNVIYVWDPELEKEYPKLPTPNFEKETVTILFNSVDHYEAITPLQDCTKDKKTLDFVNAMDIPLKQIVYI